MSAGNPCLEAALSYAHRGWPVLPIHNVIDELCSCRNPECPAPGKHPRVLHGEKDASTDEETLRRWSTTWPQANLAIVTGPKSCVVVLDVDPRNGGLEGLSLLEAKHGAAPETVTALSGGGGTHLFFKHPGSPLPSRKGFLPGLDLKSDSGYVLVEPSTHPSGGTYRFEASSGPDDLPLAPLPPAWLEFFRVQNAPGQNGRGFELPEEIVEGRRNDLLFRFACGLRHYAFDEARILGILLEENASRCSPPLEEDEVRSIAASAARQEPESFTRAKHTAGDAPAGEASTGPAFLRPVQIGNLPPVSWLIDRLLPAESLACLFGPPGAGKSFVLLDMALAIARGAPWHGRPTKRGAVVFCAAEGGTGLGGRFRAWSKGYGIPLERLERDAAPVLVSFDVPQLLDPFAVDVWSSAILANLNGDGVCLTVIDTLSRSIAGGDENSAAFISKAVETAERLRRKVGGAIILCHHTGKDPEKGERGSSALRGAVEALLELTAESGAIQLSVRKQKDGELPPSIPLVLSPVEVGYDEEGREVTSCFVRARTPIDAARGDTEATLRVLAALGRPAARRDGMRWGELVEVARVSKATLSRQLWDLRDGGRVKKRGEKYFLAELGDEK